MLKEAPPQIETQVVEPDLLDRFRDRTANLGHKLIRLGVVGLAIAATSFSITTMKEAISPSEALAETLDYPWADAPCQFGSQGGDSCTNPNNAFDKYDWGWYINNVFHPYRNGYQYRNCTDYVQWKLATLGASVPGNLGNGGQWYDNAPENTEKSTTPHAWDAAVVPGNPGHVAFVESVNGDGTITISEYNHDAKGHGGKRTGTPGSMGFTKFIDFGVSPANTPPPTPANITTTLESHSSGPISSILESSGRRDIFTGTDTGNLYWSHWAPNESWSTGEIASPGSPINAVTSVLWNDGKLGVYYGTTDGKMYESWYAPGSGWTTGEIASTGSSINGITAQVINADAANQLNVYYGTSDGKIRESWWRTGLPWTTSVIDTVSASVEDMAMLRPTNGEDTVVLSGTSSGELHEDYWRGQGYSWVGGQKAYFGTAISSLIAMMSDTTETAYIGTASGDIKEAWFAIGDSSWSTGTPGSYSNAVTALTGLTKTSGGVVNVSVFGSTASGNLLNERFWSTGNSWAGGQIASIGDLVLGATSMETSSGAKVVYTLTDGGVIKESWWAAGQSAWTTSQIATVE